MKAIATLFLCLALASCSLTVSPDGSKSATLDAPSAIQFAEIIAAK